MSIVITPITDHELYQVNNKEVYKDTNNNWVAREELTTAELKEFRSYKEKAID